jgi:hypothetical protein
LEILSLSLVVATEVGFPAFVNLLMSITLLSLFPKPEVFNFKLIYLNQQNFRKKEKM